MIHSKPLQTADIDGVIHHSPAALFFARVLADVGTGAGEGVVLANQAHRVIVPLLPDESHIAWDIHMGRAGGHTGHGIAQGTDTAAMVDMFLIVLPEAPNTLEHHMGRLITDGAVSAVGNNLCGTLDEVNGLQRGGAVKHLLDEHSELAQTHPAGHALAAGLGMAQPQEIQGHIHRTQARLAGADAPPHVPVQAAQNSLGPPRCFNG